MNCFVIMPFAPEFDDVYVAIKASVVNATSPNRCRCFRLDETRPAGRITDRLLQELRTASLCVAAGNRPNVMCEVGFENFAYEEISLEGEMSQEVQKSLEMRGHHLRRVGSVGILQGILMDPKTGTFMGAAAPRGSGQSAGW